jgi:glycosyltransferase involved in cell wall biosynthesis
MKHADALILSTDYLANLAQAATQRPAFTLHNAVSAEMQQHAHQALYKPHPPDDLVRIGYFSGHARVHDEDFATLGAVLAQLLSIHPQLIITLVGEVTLPPELTAFTQRIERRPAVDWRLLPSEIARVSINIAPLVENPQRRSKSGIKYLEAALVGIPTVAIALEPYQTVIEPGVTGLLAGSPTEWFQALDTLITSPELHRQIGNAARQHVLTQHTTAVRAARLAEVVQAIMNQRITHNA